VHRGSESTGAGSSLCVLRCTAEPRACNTVWTCSDVQEGGTAGTYGLDRASTKSGHTTAHVSMLYDQDDSACHGTMITQPCAVTHVHTPCPCSSAILPTGSLRNTCVLHQTSQLHSSSCAIQPQLSAYTSNSGCQTDATQSALHSRFALCSMQLTFIHIEQT
jgi:hypothetical protein